MNIYSCASPGDLLWSESQLEYTLWQSNMAMNMEYSERWCSYWNRKISTRFPKKPRGWWHWISEKGYLNWVGWPLSRNHPHIRSPCQASVKPSSSWAKSPSERTIVGMVNSKKLILWAAFYPWSHTSSIKSIQNIPWISFWLYLSIMKNIDYILSTY